MTLLGQPRFDLKTSKVDFITYKVLFFFNLSNSCVFNWNAYYKAYSYRIL